MVPAPLLESDHEVMVKPMKRDSSHSKMECIYIFLHLQKISRLE